VENALIKTSHYALPTDEISFATFLELALMDEAGLYKNSQVKFTLFILETT
jgi:hypothetical protein